MGKEQQQPSQLQDKKKQEEKPEEKRYTVKHHQVGAFEHGRVLTLRDFRSIYSEFGDRELQRLIDMKAIEPTDQPRTETPIEAGPENPTNPPEAQGLHTPPPAAGAPGTPGTGTKEVESPQGK